jgi:hypothetical protein
MVHHPRERHPAVTTGPLVHEQLAAIGAIAIMTALIESRAETMVWDLAKGFCTSENGHPWTEGKPISTLLAKIRELGEVHAKAGVPPLYSAWCDAAEEAFKCRNIIIHGLVERQDDDLFGGSLFTKDRPIGQGMTVITPEGPKLFGEVIRRKRPHKSLAANTNALSKFEGALATIYDAASLLWAVGNSDEPVGSLEVSWVRQLHRARANIAELVVLEDRAIP